MAVNFFNVFALKFAYFGGFEKINDVRRYKVMWERTRFTKLEVVRKR